MSWLAAASDYGGLNPKTKSKPFNSTPQCDTLMLPTTATGSVYSAVVDRLEHPGLHGLSAHRCFSTLGRWRNGREFVGSSGAAAALSVRR